MLLVFIAFYQMVGALIFDALALFGAPRFQCKYALTCSQFAKEEIHSNPKLASAILRIGQRLLFCSPLKNKWTESLTRCVELPQNALPDFRKV